VVLAPADFHENPRAGDRGGDFGNEGAGKVWIAILVDELQKGAFYPGW